VLIPLPLCFDLFTGEDCSITGDGQVDNSEINAEPTSWIELRGFSHFADLMQEPHTVSEYQIGLSLAVFKKLKLTFSCEKWHTLATIHGPYTDRLIFQSPRQNAFIVGNGTVFLECAPTLAIQLVRICNLGFSTYRYLRRQAKLLAHRIVAGMVKGILMESLGFPSDIADVITRSICFLKRIKKRAALLFSWLEFHLCNQFHTQIIAQAF